jgi:cytochrome c-type biogenesis protein CcmH/NrfG
MVETGEIVMWGIVIIFAIILFYILKNKRKYWQSLPRETNNYKIERQQRKERERDYKRRLEEEENLAYKIEKAKLKAQEDYNKDKKYRQYVDSGGLLKDVRKSLDPRF